MELKYSESTLMSHIMRDYTLIDDIKVLAQDSPFDDYLLNIYLASLKQAISENPAGVRRVIKHRSFQLFKSQSGKSAAEFEKGIRGLYNPNVDICSIEQIFLEYYKKRRLSVLGGSLVNCLHDNTTAESILSGLQASVLQLDQSCDKDAGMTKKEACRLLYEKMERLTNNEQIYITSGIRPLDKLIGGFSLGDSWLLAARPSIGKTAFGLTLMDHMIYNLDKTCLFISVEMPVNQLLERCVQIRSELNINEALHEQGRSKHFANTANIMQGDRRLLLAKTTDRRIGNIRSIIRKAKRDNPELEVIFVDYIQKILSDDKKKGNVEVIEEASGVLTDIADDLNILILPLAQLRRQMDPKSMPNLEGLKGAGRLEEDAHGVIMIHRDDRASEDVTLIVPKNRNGYVGAVKCCYTPNITKFHNDESGYDHY